MLAADWGRVVRVAAVCQVPVTGQVVAKVWAVMAQVVRGRVAVMEPVVAMARVEMGSPVAAARFAAVARRFVQRY
jgi:hypothetical protein